MLCLKDIPESPTDLQNMKICQIQCTVARFFENCNIARRFFAFIRDAPNGMQVSENCNIVRRFLDFIRDAPNGMLCFKANSKSGTNRPNMKMFQIQCTVARFF